MAIVTGAEVADLDVDGSPEVYVYVRSERRRCRRDRLSPTSRTIASH